MEGRCQPNLAVRNIFVCKLFEKGLISRNMQEVKLNRTWKIYQLIVIVSFLKQDV